MNAQIVNYWEESLEMGFLSWIEKHGYSHKTKLTYESMFFAFTAFLEKNQIALKDANKTVADLFFKERAVSQKTVMTYLWLISDLLDDMVDSGFIQENRMSLVLEKKRKGMRGKSAKRLPVFLNSQESAQLENYVSNLPRHYSGMRERCTLLLLSDAGLRAQEVCDLKVMNMHLNNEPPYIKIIGKFNKERIVPLTPGVVNELLEFMEMRNKRTPFFLNSKNNGNPYVTSSVYRLAKTAMQDAGIVKSKLSPHVLRHTYCTRQLQEGIPLGTVKQWMGHESIATTAIYEHMIAALHSDTPASFRKGQ